MGINWIVVVFSATQSMQRQEWLTRDKHRVSSSPLESAYISSTITLLALLIPFGPSTAAAAAGASLVEKGDAGGGGDGGGISSWSGGRFTPLGPKVYVIMAMGFFVWVQGDVMVGKKKIWLLDQ
ncbi:hypothetical protein ACJX0J_021476 [Zea mays]